MSSRSIFYDDWRDCLRAHFVHVINNNDMLNAVSLRTVLLDTGFTASEIDDLQHSAQAVTETIEAAEEMTASESVAEVPVSKIPVTAIEDAQPPAEPEGEPAPESEWVEWPPKADTPKVQFFQQSLF